MLFKKISLACNSHNIQILPDFIPLMKKHFSNFSEGDGMSVATITAGRIMKGQLQDKSGEETVLAMDKFHHAGLSKVS